MYIADAYSAGKKVGTWYSWTAIGQRKKEKFGGTKDEGRCWWHLL